MKRRTQSASSRLIGAMLGSVLAAISAVPSAQAQSSPAVDGSVTFAYYYLGDAPESGLDAGAKSRLLGRYRLNVTNLGEAVSLHTSFSTRRWWEGSRDGDNELRFYQAYARYRRGGWGDRWDMNVGRHWIAAGGANGLVDGVSLFMDKRRLRLGAFIGTRDPEDRDEVRWPSFDRSRWWGVTGRLGITRRAEVSAGYDATRRDDQDDTEVLFVGAEVRPKLGVTLRYQMRYDYTRDDWLGRTFLASWRPDGRREVWVESSQRWPQLGYSSFFARFRNLIDHQRLELRGGARMPLGPELEGGVYGSAIEHGEASPLDATGDPRFEAREPDSWSNDLRLQLTWRGQMVGYFGAWGYGGSRDGLTWMLHRPLDETFRLTFSGNWVDYTYGRGTAVDEEVATLSAGLEADLNNETWISGDVEYLDHSDDSEWRVLLRVRRGFRAGGE